MLEAEPGPCGAGRAAWTLPLLISNITLDMRSFIFCWNIPVQLQFYLLLPLIGLLLQPQSPSFRRRIAWTCVLAAVVATLYRIAIVMAFSIQAQLPIGAHSHAASHHPSSVVAAWGFLDWLYSAFISRMTDLALGILIYLIIASPRACAAIRSRPWVCTIVSALVSAFVVSTCLADSDIRPRPEEVAPLSARLGVQVVAFGVVVPVTMAWLVLYVLVQPGWPARRAAEILGSPKWDWLAARTYSVFLLHPFVAFGLFQTVPVTSWIGPLAHFSTYAVVFGLVMSTSIGLAWVQDRQLDRFTGWAQGKFMASKAKKAS